MRTTLALALMLVLIPAFSHAAGRSWTRFFDSAGGVEFSYDTTSVERTKSGTVKVWVLADFRPVLKTMEKMYSNTEFTEALEEYDCKNRKGRTIEQVYRAMGGATEKKKGSGVWGGAKEGSYSEELLNLLCK